MPAGTAASLFLLEDLEDISRTSELADSELAALQAVADWINTFVAAPHKDLGRTGPVCPFVPGSLERKTLWLASEQIADRDVPAVIEVMNGYIRRLLKAQPTDGDDTKYKTIVIIFTDLRADRAQAVFDDGRRCERLEGHAQASAMDHWGSADASARNACLTNAIVSVNKKRRARPSSPSRCL